ncbi:unnamed protein product [Protopolystoma xenopodis]|uniref:Uncharacterized protein n=1 Tax=Protopolystoma xenopodis TaxID=117903 RepID=A0A448XMC3_9PLAT|nr:unnamed protein product [Protopolystoma xenopodis]
MCRQEVSRWIGWGLPDSNGCAVTSQCMQTVGQSGCYDNKDWAICFWPNPAGIKGGGRRLSSRAGSNQ